MDCCDLAVDKFGDIRLAIDRSNGWECAKGRHNPHLKRGPLAAINAVKLVT